MSDEKPSAPPTTRYRTWGSIAQGVGVLGVGIGVVVAVLVLIVRGRVADRVDAIAGQIDDGLAKGVPLFAAARERIDGMSALVQELGAKVEARDGDGKAEEVARALREKVTALSERYAGMRVSFVRARERVLAALDRLETVDQMLPSVDIPKGPVDALEAMDERIRTLDADILGLLAVAPEAGSGLLSAAITARVTRVEATLVATSTGFGNLGDRLGRLRDAAAAAARRSHRVIGVVAVVLALVFLYSAFLHGVLYRLGSRMRTSVVV